jgi:signal peptidase I
MQDEIDAEVKIEKTKPESWWDLVKFALIALAIVIPIRLFIAEPFVVSGSSMVPTFENSDYLIIDKISYELGEPRRDDVVVFKYPNDTSKYFIKRIIGLPNETIDIRGSTITITSDTHPDGLVLDQSYLKNISSNNVHLKLKSDEYYVMGDNRPASSDSRYWGPLKRNFMAGRVLLRLLPLKNMDLLPGHFTQAD